MRCFSYFFSRYLLSFKRKSFLLLLSSLFSFIFLTIIHQEGNAYLDHFMNIQEKNLKKAGYSFSFQSISPASWNLFPKRTITFPTLTFSDQTVTIKKWTAKKLTLSYSPFHPFSISMIIDGEQFLCVSQMKSCIQLHGNPWSVYIPVFNNQLNSSATFSIPELFFSLPITDGQTLKIKAYRLHQTLHWNLKKNQQTPFFSSIFSAQRLSLYLDQAHHYEIRKFLTKFALTQAKTSAFPILLLHTLQGKIDHLFINGTGKFNISALPRKPTGELVIYLSGTKPLLFDYLSKTNSLTPSEKNRLYTHIPDHITFPLFIRQKGIFFGNLSLSSESFSIFLRTIAFPSHGNDF